MQKTVLFRPRSASGTRRRSTTEQMTSVPHWRVAIIPDSPTSHACSAPRWSGYASLLLRRPLRKRLGQPDQGQSQDQAQNGRIVEEEPHESERRRNDGGEQAQGDSHGAQREQRRA